MQAVRNFMKLSSHGARWVKQSHDLENLEWTQRNSRSMHLERLADESANLFLGPHNSTGHNIHPLSHYIPSTINCHTPRHESQPRISKIGTVVTLGHEIWQTSIALSDFYFCTYPTTHYNPFHLISICALGILGCLLWLRVGVLNTKGSGWVTPRFMYFRRSNLGQSNWNQCIFTYNTYVYISYLYIYIYIYTCSIYLEINQLCIGVFSAVFLGLMALQSPTVNK